jgi:hypothetical protein
MALRYITLNQLMASVEADLPTFADSGMIDRGKIIKVIRRVNEDLGLKINNEREGVVEIINGKGRLPEDFYILQMAAICSKETYHLPGEIHGTLTEDCTTELTTDYKVVQTFRDKTITFNTLHPVQVTSNSRCASHCPNIGLRCQHSIVVTEDNEILAGFQEGKVYINYLAEMVDKDNNILVLDHPLVRDYYEYAAKKHLIEVWLLNNDADVAEKWKLVKAELYEARLRALNFINTIEYSQIQKVYDANRNRFYQKHMRMFE